MRAILEYITMNYTWFLGTAIIILLAIIGSYADKTNFGQGKTKEKKEETPNLEEEVNNESLKQLIEKEEPEIAKEKDEQLNSDNSDETTSKEGQIVFNKIGNIKEGDNLVVVKVEKPTENKKANFEEAFAKFDQEFDAIVPKKDIIDEELLDEIDNLSLDKTQKLKLTDIPDLDDLDLPKIKSLDPVDEDIWKF